MPPKSSDFPHEDSDYQSGFGNHFSSEAIAGALPQGQNSPLICPLGLYAEQISGTSFTAPRNLNQRRYTPNISMDNCAFCNADGDFLIVPQMGRLWITTECGKLQVSPGEVVILPQGFRFSIALPDGPSRGYVAEVRMVLLLNGISLFPQLHLSGKLAQVTQSYKNLGANFLLLNKISRHSTWLLAWHGNYVPYKYDLSKFCPYNTVLVDHGDPSINTVLTAPTVKPGVA
ncbi:hypothetical protein L1987_02323 [Smallanthus sonchifolius]|uniref:Uncharacterized protein n=1 Tax=Smallanthus sonchifolius TaxID=185202 RepID=A0ACB9K7E2_9ASTR|nr:hypothetical protein L1987_02323 [Smallanthus sonchifolius]